MKQLLIHLLVVAGWLGSGPFLRAGGVVQDCTEAGLREALRDGGVVTFACDGVIDLAQPIVISADTALDAGGREVTLSGRQAVRLFEVRPGATLQLVNLTLTQGRAGNGGAVFCEGATLILDRCALVGHWATGVPGAADRPGTPARGGALFASSSVVQVDHCTFADNQALGGPGGTSTRQGGRGGTALGGALCVTGGALRVSHSKFLDNGARGGAGGRGIQGGNGGDALGGAAYCESNDVEWTQTEIVRGRARGGEGGPGTVQAGPLGAGQGGGLYQAAGLMQLTACTVASCEAAGSPPNRARGGGLFNMATLLAFNTTVVSNYTSMVPDGDSQGGGLYNEGFLTAEHCTVAANAATGAVQDKGGNLENAGGFVALRGTIIAYCRNQWDVFGRVIDQGGNICWDNTAQFTDPTSRNRVDPKLGPLADNGGPVRTMLPLPGSPAVDAVKIAGTLTQDARGVARPGGAHADAGAVEGAGLEPILAVSFEPTVVRTNAVAWLHVSAQNPNPFTLRGLALRPTLPAGFAVAPAPRAEIGCDGIVQAAPGTSKPSGTFPALGPLETCSFSVPIVALTPSTGVVALASTTSENLGTLAGTTASATIKAMASALVVTLPAEPGSNGTVVLKGRANPVGQGATAYFEYGPDTIWGQRTEVQTIAPGVFEVTLQATLPALASLDEATQYHARLVVVEFGDRILGNDVNFATPSRGGGTALAFDGVDDWVKVEPGLGSTAQRFTIEFWAWPTGGQALPPGGEGVQGVYPERPLRFAVYPAHGQRRFGPGHAGVGVSVSTNGVVVFERGQDLFAPVLIHAAPLTGWTHVAVTYGDGPPRLYLNMNLVRTGLSNGLIHHPSIEIGSSHDSPEPGDGYYQGYLDEVRIWDHVLGRQELLLLAEAPVAGSALGLVAMLHLDEGVGSLVADATGHGFHGEAFNSPSWLPSSAPMGAGLVRTADTVGVTAHEATLTALVGLAETGGQVHFEWGVAGGPLHSTEPRAATPSTNLSTHTATLTGLRPALVYRFQAVLESPGATLRGGWREFETGTTPHTTHALLLGGGGQGVLAGTPFSNLTDNFTVEFWVRPTNHRPVTSESVTEIQGVESQPFVSYPQYGDPAYGSAHAVAGIAVGTNGVSVFEHSAFYRPSVLVHSAVLRDWVHVAVVYRQRQASLLLNGVPIHTGLAGPLPVHPSGDLGCTTAALGETSSRLVGELDEVRIWNAARSAEEIRQNMNRRLTGTEAGLVLYYDFDDDPGPEIPDRSTAARRGLVTGSPTWIAASPPLGPASVLSTTVTAIETDRASVTGEVDVFENDLTAQFEWGLTPAYGNLTSPQRLANGPGIQHVTAQLEGLTTGTTYFYRLVVEQAGHFAVSRGSSLLTRPDGPSVALAFDGLNGTVTLPMEASTNLGRSFTLEFWCHPTAERAESAQIAQGVIALATQRFVVYPDYGPSFLGEGTAGVGLSVGINGITIVEHGANRWAPVLVHSQPLAGWNHVAVTYVEGRPRLFVNGTLAKEGLQGNLPVRPGFHLGGGPPVIGTPCYYQGELDEFRVWNRALSPEEIGMSMRQWISSVWPGLVWGHHFEENFGTATFDLVDPTRAGILSPGVTWVRTGAISVPLAPSTRLANGSVRLQFAAYPQRPLILSRSTDLTHWTPIETNLAPASGVFEYVDEEVPNHPYRFYRVLSPP